MRIFLTGASSGIGAAMARQFDAMGAELGLVGRNAQKLEDFAATLNSPARRFLLPHATLTVPRLPTSSLPMPASPSA